MIKTIFFDFGNVIAFFDHQRAIRHLTAFTDRAADDLTLMFYGSPVEDDYETGKLTTAQFVAHALKDGELRCTAEQFLAGFVDIFWRNDDVCDIIPRLKPRYRLVLASNTNDAHYRKYTAMFADVLRHFDHLCPSHLAGSRKPHAEYFAHCQKFANAAPNECLFVDDLPINVEHAERHGWKGVCYDSTVPLEAQLRAAGVELR